MGFKIKKILISVLFFPHNQYVFFFTVDNINNYIGEQYVRSGKTAPYSDNRIMVYGQIGTDAIIYENKHTDKPFLDTLLCVGTGFTARTQYPQYENFWEPHNIYANSLYINEPGLYTLTTTAPHCTFTNQYQVRLAEEEVLTIQQNDTTICTQAPITIQTIIKGPVSNLRWNNGTTGTELNNIGQSGTYHITGDGYCGTLSDTIHIIAEDCSCKPFVPTGFTPNGDGLNDRLFTYIDCENRYYQFKVFNRWGQIVFQSQQPDSYWDGSYKGKPAELGVYHYYMEFRDKLNKKQSFKGEVHLIR